MSQFFYIHPDNPQQRLINRAVEIVRKGGVIVYPTDSGYALGCKIEDKNAMERICRIRQLPDGHNFTLMCRDLSELSTYSFVDNVAFRLMKKQHAGQLHLHPERDEGGATPSVAGKTQNHRYACAF